jgi:hypothetical protein
MALAQLLGMRELRTAPAAIMPSTQLLLFSQNQTGLNALCGIIVILFFCHKPNCQI